MEKTSIIPVIDFSLLGLDSNLDDKECASNKDVKDLSRKIVEACNTVGFVYLKNHGITNTEINEAQQKNDEFMALPIEIKSRYTRTASDHGWVHMGMERVKPKRPGDLKECFNICPYLAKKWPNDVVPNFKRDEMKFFRRCNQLSHRVLKVLAIGLDIKNLDYFNDNHQTFKRANRTTLRFLYYPSIQSQEMKPEQVRLGEHTDYGSITLLFQDDKGGLEVQTRDNIWIPATPIEGTVLVNIGDVMQRWTADKLVSTPHRVFSIPNDPQGKSKERRSIAFFVHPDDQCMVECIDGSNKYPAILQKDYLDMKLNETY